MAGPSNYLATKMIKHLMSYQTNPYTCPGPQYLRLYSANPDFDTGSGGTEMVATGYTTGGQSVTMTAANWNAATTQGNGKRVTNIVVPSWTATAADWEEILGAAFWDNNSGGNLMWGKADDNHPTLGNGDSFRYSAAALKLDLDTTASAGINNFWKAEILDHVTATDRSYTPPNTAYLALYTTNPNFVTGTDPTSGECAAGDYARKSITMSGATWTFDSAGGCTNTSEIAFSAATSSWGDITGAALVSSSSGAGNIFCGDGFTAVSIGNGDTFKIAAGDFDVSIV